MLSSKGKGKHLNESKRNEIIAKLSKPNPSTKWLLACEYGISKGAKQKTWDNKDASQQCSVLMSEEARTKIFCASVGLSSEVEDKLFIWIDAMCWANLPITPSSAITKAKQIAAGLSIPDFKASWQWLSHFRACKGMQKILLHGEGGEVDKNDPVLLATLDDLYAIIQEYNLEIMYNMDETRLFFWILLQYSILMPQEDLNIVRGTNKVNEQVTLVVCANATGMHKIPWALIGKPKPLACVKNWVWPWFNQGKAWMDKAICLKWFN